MRRGSEHFWYAVLVKHTRRWAERDIRPYHQKSDSTSNLSISESETSFARTAHVQVAGDSVFVNVLIPNFVGYQVSRWPARSSFKDILKFGGWLAE